MKQRRIIAILAMILVLVLCVGVFAACNKKGEIQPYNITKRASTGWEDSRSYTMNDYTSQMPDVWNTILTSDNTNVSLADYFNSSFYEFNYQFDADGNIVPGGYTVDYSASTKLEDVTAKYAGQYGLKADATKGQAFAMTLRDDLKWDDGTPIKAADFVYSMQQQLSPNYLFATASGYYSGNYIIHNAQNYVKQGQSGWFSAVDVAAYGDNISSLDGLYFDATNVSAFGSIFNQTDMTKLSGYSQYFVSGGVNVYDELVAYAGDNRVAMTQALFDKIKGLFAADGGLNPNVSGWGWADSEIGYFTVVNYTYPAMDFSEVGYFVGENEYELVMVIDNTLNPIDDEGNLTYEAGYYFSSWPLVKKDLWEANEDKTTTPYTNSYCSGSVAKSASWGPYKLTNYQADKTYTVSRNENWFGYGLDQYAGQYQTDQIVTEKVEEWDTAWMMFQKGQIDGISMDVKIAGDYRNSSQAYFTPETYTFDLNLQSRANTRSDTRNNLLLNYSDFRKAISLSLDRDDYCAKNSPSSQAALGLLNNMYYYDVENGLVYRDSVQAKEAILNAYGAEKVEGGWKVGTIVYDDIDEAIDATTGYNLTLARQLMTSAYNQAVAAGDYADGEKIILTFGIETQTANTDRIKNWFQAAFDAATVGTPLAGKIEIAYYQFSSATWSQDFEDGKYDLCFGAWGSAAFNPYYLLCETQISEDNRYAQGWDPASVSVTVTLSDNQEYTYNLEQWSANLQGKEGCIKNFAYASNEDKLTILGAIETAILDAYYSVPVYSRYSASLMGYKTDYISYEYNTFMSYGGIRYMSYNFDDAEWAAFVAEKTAENNGSLKYDFSK